MQIQALSAFSYVDDGEVFSIAHGAIVTIDDTLAQGFIADGLAQEYTLVTPRNNLSIDANGTYDVTQYAGVVVDVDVLTVTYDANGGTGTVAAVNVAAGDSITLSDGTGLTAPEGKEFAGWATEAATDEPDVTSPYAPSASVTLYAVYTAITQTEE